MLRPLALLAFFLALFPSACSGGGAMSYQYSAVRGVRIINGQASVPDDAPDEVKAAIAAGNRICHLPYLYGGGRCDGVDSGYDCSGSASYVLREAGLLGDWLTSTGFKNYGRSGRGKWITIYAKSGHVFLEVAGLRFDTGRHGSGEGPRWTTASRPATGCVLRHPPGL